MKYLLFIFNVIFFLSGAALLALGLWMLLDPNFNDYIDVVSIDDSNPYVAAAIYMLIGIGAFIFLVGFLGCCGACKESPCMLCTYVILLVVVLLAELAVGVLIIVNDQSLGKEIEEHMIKTAREDVEDKYDEDMSPITASWNAMQVNLKCCGGAGYKDYRKNPNFGISLQNLARPVPKTCCVLEEDGKDPKNPQPVSETICMAEALVNLTENTKHLYVKGCYDELLVWFDTNKIILVCVAFGVALLQIFGIIFACCVRKEVLKPVDYAAVKT